MHSHTEENYLKSIYKLGEQHDGLVSTSAIAEKLATKAASVTDMLKRLAEKKLISYQKYYGVSLTAKGEKVALMIIRKHRLWEMFLVEKLGFTWDEVHEVAEQLEHIDSEKLIGQIDKFLNFPKSDPHGDPIPDANGKIKARRLRTLSQHRVHDTCLMTGVVDHTASFLQYLDKTGLIPGSEIRIRDYIPFDKSLQVSINNKHNIFISHEVAKNILVTRK